MLVAKPRAWTVQCSTYFNSHYYINLVAKCGFTYTHTHRRTIRSHKSKVLNAAIVAYYGDRKKGDRCVFTLKIDFWPWAHQHILALLTAMSKTQCRTIGNANVNLLTILKETTDDNKNHTTQVNELLFTVISPIKGQLFSQHFDRKSVCQMET